MLGTTVRRILPGLVSTLAVLLALAWGERVQAQPPGFPRMPNPPFGPNNPPGPGNMPGMGPGNPGFKPPGFGGNGKLFETVWTCSKCGREVGRGDFPPGSCPYCGVNFVNGFGPANPPGGAPFNPPMNPGTNPPFNPGMPPGGNPQPPFNPAPPNNQPNNSGGPEGPGQAGQDDNVAPGVQPFTGGNANRPSSPSGERTAPMWVGRVVLGLLVVVFALALVAVCVVIVVIRNASQSSVGVSSRHGPPARRPRRIVRTP